jgi:hypothetical protein
MTLDQELESDVLDARRVREVAGAFRTMQNLDAALDDLLKGGFDRADIDLLGPAEALRRRFGDKIPPIEDMADVPHAPRQPVILKDDFALLTMSWTAIVSYLVGISTALVAVSLGAGFLNSLIAAVVFAALAGLIAYAVIGQYRRRKRADIADMLRLGGILVWVRIRSPEDEAKAIDILNGHHAEAVRVHEMLLTRTVDDVPVIPRDPWLEGSAPLDR